MPGLVPNCEFQIAYITEDFDPTKNARVKLQIPGFTYESTSPFVRCIFPFGQKGPLRRGEQVGVLITESIHGSYTLMVLGSIYSNPSGKGSQAPLAQNEPVRSLGVIGAGKYSKLHVVELVQSEQESSEAWLVKVKGSNVALIVDAANEQIVLDPGGQNVVLAPAKQSDARVAVEGDPVEVQSPDGPLRGRIVAGSAPMVARKIS